MRVMIINLRQRLGRLGLIAFGLVLIALMAGPLRGPTEVLMAVMSGGNKLRPIYSVDTPDKKIAISFDACWGADLTRPILDILNKYDVRTTFFLVNIWIDDYPELVKTIVAEGHELGLHSTAHPDFAKLSEAQMEQELKDNYDAIVRVSGFKPILFRPPFGSYNNTMIQVCERMGIHAIQWDVDSLDWKDLSAVEIHRRVVNGVKPGSIVLFHNNGKHTAAALPGIIETLQGQGYEIVPISELIHLDNYYVDNNGVQRKKTPSPEPN